MSDLGLRATFEFPLEQLEAAEQALAESSTNFECERITPPGEHELALGESIELKLQLGNKPLRYKITLVRLDENSPEIVDRVEDIVPIDQVTRQPFTVGDIVVHVLPSTLVDDPEIKPDTYQLDSFEFLTQQKINPKLE